MNTYETRVDFKLHGASPWSKCIYILVALCDVLIKTNMFTPEMIVLIWVMLLDEHS